MFFVPFFVLLVRFFCFPCSNFFSTFVFAYLCLLFILFFHRPFMLSRFSLSLILSLYLSTPSLPLSLIQQRSVISNFSTAVRPVLVLHVDYSKAFRTCVRPPCKCCHSASDWAATRVAPNPLPLYYSLSLPLYAI